MEDEKPLPPLVTGPGLARPLGNYVLPPPSNPARLPIQKSLAQLLLDSVKGQTWRIYKSAIYDFAKFCGYPGQSDRLNLVFFNETAAETVQALASSYRTELVKRGQAPNTINVKLTVIRSLVKLGRLTGACNYDIDLKNVSNKSYSDVRGIGEQPFRRIVKRLSQRVDPRGVRDYAMARLIHDMGLRRSDAAKIDIEHLDLPGNRAMVTDKWLSSRQWAFLPSPTIEALWQWVRLRTDKPGPVFISLSPEMMQRDMDERRLSAKTIADTIKAIGCREAGKNTRPASPSTEMVTDINAEIAKIRAQKRNPDFSN